MNNAFRRLPAFVLASMLMATSGCWHREAGDPSPRDVGPTPKDLGANAGRKGDLISDSRAIEIAKLEIAKYVETQPGAPIEVAREAGRCFVTFVHISPPGVRGSDYDARVEIDPVSGEVLEVMRGD